MELGVGRLRCPENSQIDGTEIMGRWIEREYGRVLIVLDGCANEFYGFQIHNEPFSFRHNIYIL